VTSATQKASEPDVRLQFARQLYEACLAQYGKDHEQTRLMLKYVIFLECSNTTEHRFPVESPSSVCVPK
jgi:hypothetical protein